VKKRSVQSFNFKLWRTDTVRWRQCNEPVLGEEGMHRPAVVAMCWRAGEATGLEAAADLGRLVGEGTFVA